MILRNKKKSFETNSIIVFALFMVANVSNYVFQITMGRMLTVDEYSVVNTLFSYSNVLTVAAAVITLLASKLSAQMSDYSVVATYEIVRKRLFKLTIFILVLTLVLGMAFGVLLAPTWKVGYYLIVGIVAATAVKQIHAVSKGVLQGKELFLQFGLQNIVLSVAKLIMSIFFVALGFGVFGTVVGFAVAGILAFVYAVVAMRKADIRIQGSSLTSNNWREGNIEAISVKQVFAKDFLIYLCAVLLANGDLLIVRSLVDGDVAGQYSAAANLVRIAFYISTAIVSTMFPMAVRQKNQGGSSIKILIKSMIYGGGSAIIIVVGLLLVGKPFIGLIFGSRYIGAIEYILPASFYIVPVSLLTICSNYFIAIGKHRYFFGSFIVGLLLSMWWFYMVDDVKVMFAGIGIITLVVDLANIFYCARNDKES